VEPTSTGPAGETIDTPRHRALASPSRVAILRLVRLAPAGRTIAEVAAAAGLHASTARAHLDRLAEAGLLVRERDPGGVPGRPAWRYRSAAPEPAPGPYRDLAAVLLGHLSEHGDGAAAASRVGEDWGRRLAAETPAPAAAPVNPAAPVHAAPVATLLRVLDRLGFAPALVPDDPDRPGGSPVLHLRACPFLELVDGNAEAMCGVHRGVILGALTAGGATGAAAVLEPFGAPDACVVRLPSADQADAGVAG
jgi:predicted ArsR family transcriptional regulator